MSAMDGVAKIQSEKILVGAGFVVFEKLENNILRFRSFWFWFYYYLWSLKFHVGASIVLGYFGNQVFRKYLKLKKKRI